MNRIINKNFKASLRFVFFIATPLSLVNTCIANWNSTDFFLTWMSGFLWIYPISFTQAICYVSLIKWYDRRKLAKKQQINS